jgi:hypothetical protein
VNLRLYDDRAAEFAGDRFGLLGGGGNLARWNGDAALPKDFLCLVLVDIHLCSERVRARDVSK